MNNDPAVGANIANRHSGLGGNTARLFASTPVATLAGDFVKQIDGHNTATTADDTFVMTDGNYTPIPGDAFEANALDLISGTGGADVIDGMGSTDKCRRWCDGTLMARAGRAEKVGAGGTAGNDRTWRIAA